MLSAVKRRYFYGSSFSRICLLGLDFGSVVGFMCVYVCNCTRCCFLVQLPSVWLCLAVSLRLSMFLGTFEKKIGGFLH